MLRRDHISHFSEYVVSSLSIYFALIAIVLKNYNADFLYHCWFLFTEGPEGHVMKFTILVDPSLVIITKYIICLIFAESREEDF